MFVSRQVLKIKRNLWYFRQESPLKYRTWYQFKSISTEQKFSDGIDLVATASRKRKRSSHRTCLYDSWKVWLGSVILHKIFIAFKCFGHAMWYSRLVHCIYSYKKYCTWAIELYQQETGNSDLELRKQSRSTEAIWEVSDQ